METPIRLLLVDDEASVRRGLMMCMAAEPDFDVVGEAPDGEVGVSLATELEPDVVIMDLQMHPVDGLTATREICSLRPGCCVVILSLHDDIHTRRAADEAGAHAFVGKQQGCDELFATIRRLARPAS